MFASLPCTNATFKRIIIFCETNKYSNTFELECVYRLLCMEHIIGWYIVDTFNGYQCFHVYNIMYIYTMDTCNDHHHDWSIIGSISVHNPPRVSR